MALTSSSVTVATSLQGVLLYRRYESHGRRTEGERQVPSPGLAVQPSHMCFVIFIHPLLIQGWNVLRFNICLAAGVVQVEGGTWPGETKQSTTLSHRTEEQGEDISQMQSSVGCT